MSAQRGQEPGSRLGVVVPVVREPRGLAPRRVLSREQVSPFTTGVVVTGVVVGGPVSVVAGVLDGQVGAVAFPAAVAVVGWQWWRREGVAGMRRDLSQLPLRRGDWRQAAVGAVTTVVALGWVFGGGVR